MFTDMEAVGKKKPEHIIKVNRFSSVIDIDNHEKKKNTFAVKVYVVNKKANKSNDNSEESSGTSASSTEAVTHWFVAENEELRQKWMKAINYVIDQKKEGQTVLHLQMVKAIQEGDSKTVLKLLHEGVYSKNAFIQYAETENTNDAHSHLKFDDETEDDDEEDDDPVSTISDKEKKQLLDMGYVEGDSLLHISIKNAQTKVVKSLMERKCDVAIKNSSGDTPLHCVFEERTYVEYPVSVEQQPITPRNTVSPSDRSTESLTPRDLSPRNVSPRSRGATMNQHKTPRDEILELLLANGSINVDTQNNNGWTPLALACKRNDYSLLSALLYKDASPDITTKEGSPLHFAIKHCNLRMVEALLKRGSADPNIVDSDGYTPLDRALDRFREPEMVKIISILFTESNPKVNVNHPDTELVKRYIYLFATHPDVFGKKGLRLLDSILESHPEYALNEYPSNSEFGQVIEVPLIQAIKSGNIETVQTILKYNSDNVDIVNKAETRDDGYKYYPLHVAMIQQLDIVTESLLNNGASCDNRSGNEQVLPMLHAAKFKVRDDLAEQIVEKTMANPEHQQSINACAVQGQTILYFASQSSGVTFVKSLIAKGADPLVTTERGETILCSACAGGNLEVVKYLIIEQGLDPKGTGREHYIDNGYPPLHCATKNGKVEVMKYLIEEHEVDINLHRHEQHMRPIQLACLNGHANAVRYLLDKNCDTSAGIKTREDAGITCLHLAAGYGFPEIVIMLLDHGLDIMQRTEVTKSSPLDFALRRNQLNVVKCLCDRGSISDSVTLQLAVQTGNDQVLEWVEQIQQQQQQQQEEQQEE
jgi:ankyrin repeat protein